MYRFMNRWRELRPYSAATIARLSVIQAGAYPSIPGRSAMMPAAVSTSVTGLSTSTLDDRADQGLDHRLLLARL
jgi:hypothetical protein